MPEPLPFLQTSHKENVRLTVVEPFYRCQGRITEPRYINAIGDDHIVTREVLRNVVTAGFGNSNATVQALDEVPENRTAIVVTAYVPDSKLWSEDFRSRKNTK